jgi:phosphoglycerate mutase (EC 5.4.2.1)
VAIDDPYHPANEPRYRDVDPALLPATESLKDTLARVLPYWRSDIAPVLQAHDTVMIAAHGNSLRALIKHLEDLSDEAITGSKLPPVTHWSTSSMKHLGFRPSTRCERINE